MIVAKLLALYLPAIIVLSCVQACGSRENTMLERAPLEAKTLAAGDTIAPFAYIDAADDDWKVEIRISGEDLHDVSHKRMKTRKFWSSDREVLAKVRSWKFIYGRGAIHKASSTLRVYNDTKLIEKYGIILEKKVVGLQSTELGFLTPVDPESLFSTLEEMN
jgi:hypothetical protein